MVSYLALAHGADRGICWQATFAGVRVGFIPSPLCDTHSGLLAELQAVCPTFLLAMPPFWTQLFLDFRDRVTAAAIPVILRLLEEVSPSSGDSLGAGPGPDAVLSVLQRSPRWSHLVDAVATWTGLSQSFPALQCACTAAHFPVRVPPRCSPRGLLIVCVVS